MNKTNFRIRTFTILCAFLSSIPVIGDCLTQPIEYYYTVKGFEAPHFHIECLSLDQDTFVELMDKVNQKTHDRAFVIEVPNKLYSENVVKLRAAQFFHYFDYPEHDSSIWCRTNGSGIPLAGSHTFGARGVVYYKENSEYYFLLVKDKYGDKGYEAPGGYVQPSDKEIIEAFEKGIYRTENLNYRSPEEAAISEVFEEANFDLTKYGYGLVNAKRPLTIADVYTKNTNSDRGIHSINNCCQYLLFEVAPNKDPLKKQDHEILDVRWASYTEIINDQIDSPIDVHSATDNVKILIQRVVAADKYKDVRNQLVTVNRKLQELIPINNIDIEEFKNLIKEQMDLEALKEELEGKLKQAHVRIGKKDIRYFSPI